MACDVVRTLLLVLFICLLPSAAAAQQDDNGAGSEGEWAFVVPQPVKVALDGADAGSLSSFFGNSVDLQLPNVSGIFSKKQSEMIIGKFLNLHKGLMYSLEHEEAAGEATLAIGTLANNDEIFRVFILLQPVADSQQIKQLRIEAQK